MNSGFKGGILLLAAVAASVLIISPLQAAEPAPSQTIQTDQNPIIFNDICPKPNGNFSILVGNNGTFVIFNGTSHQSIGSGVNSTLRRIAWRPDGSYALIVGESGTLLKFTNMDLVVTRIISGTTEDLTSVSWKPDGSFALITGSHGLIIRFDHDSQACLRIPTNTNFGLKDVTWDTSGQHAEITGDNDTSIIYPPIQVSHLSVKITEPWEGAVLTGDVALRGTASIPGGTISRVEVRIDSGCWREAALTREAARDGLQTKEDCPAWAQAFDTRGYSNGLHTLTARATSAEGESATASVVFLVSNQRLPPAIGFLSPVEGTRLFATITVQGTAASFFGPLELVELRVDDSQWGRAVGTDLWRITIDTTTFPNGVHRIQARAWDGAQFSSATLFVIVENAWPALPPAPLPPPRPAPPKGDVMIEPDTGDRVDPVPVPPASPDPRPPSGEAAPEARRPAANGGAIDIPAFSWGVLLFAALALGTEHGKFALFQFFIVPLYSRIKKDAVLDNFTRGMIYGFIMSNPGVHYNYIKQKLGLNNGSIVYHLTVLERQELIKSEKVGLYKRFYPMGQTLSESGILELNETQQQLLDLIREHPGWTQRELAERTGISTRVINYHVGLLQRARLVTMEKDGKATRCYATERMPVC